MKLSLLISMMLTLPALAQADVVISLKGNEQTYYSMATGGNLLSAQVHPEETGIKDGKSVNTRAYLEVIVRNTRFNQVAYDGRIMQILGKEQHYVYPNVAAFALPTNVSRSATFELQNKTRVRGVTDSERVTITY